MLKGTEDALAQALFAAAKGTEGDSEKAWKEVAKVLIKHITTNAVVTGVVPNGTISEGKVN